MVPHDKRIEEIKEKCKGYKNVKDFYKENPYLYRWALKHNVDVKKFPQKDRLNVNLMTDLTKE